jgi:hypothetical protein
VNVETCVSPLPSGRPGSVLPPRDAYARRYANGLVDDRARDGGEGSMLVAIREHAELHKHGLGRFGRIIPIGLRPLDRLPDRLGHPWKHSRRPLLELARVGEDRELGPVLAPRRRVDDVVQGGMKVLDRLTREEGLFLGWRLPLDGEGAVRDLVSRSRLDLCARHVGARMAPVRRCRTRSPPSRPAGPVARPMR